MLHDTDLVCTVLLGFFAIRAVNGLQSQEKRLSKSKWVVCQKSIKIELQANQESQRHCLCQ